MKLRDISLSTRITVCALITVLVSAVTLMFIENARLREAYLSEQSAHLGQELEVETTRLNQAINTLRQDVFFLSNTPPVSGIVRASLNHGLDTLYGNTHQVWAERLQQIFSAFSIAHPDYYQIRFIGVADGGRDIVRIDNRGVNIGEAPSGKLKAKDVPAYFTATLGLQEGQVQLSEFYLDPKQGDIEQPYLRSLSAATPVFTPSGKMFGMVVINMDVDNLLKYNVSDLPGVQTYLANSNGQYLLRPDTQQVTNFEQDSENKITTDFPFIKTMFDSQALDYLPLQIDTASPGSPLFAAKRIRFDPSNPSRFLLLVSYLPGDVAEQQISTIPAKTIIYSFMLMLLVGGIATLILRRTFLPLTQITEAADKIAAGDHSIRLPRTGGGEIGTLTSALISMLIKLSQREKLLQESEIRYRRLHESMMDAFSMVDMSGRILEFNHVYLDMLGYTAEEIKCLTYLDLTPEKWHDFEALIVKEQIIPYGFSQVYEKEYIRKDGSVFPVEIKTFLLRDTNNQPEAMWAIVRDISERKRVERELHDLTAHLQSIREEEKTSIAREIHDDLGGTLTALKMETYWLRTELSAYSDTDPLLVHVREMSQLIDNATGVIRKIITGLRPSILDDLGLLAAIEWQAQQFQKHTGIDCRVNCVGDNVEMDGHCSIALFRIFQETLTNVARHSGATRVEVEFCCDVEEIMLSISDNGCGLLDGHTAATNSFGLRGMCERVHQLGGLIEFDSPNDGGFRVTIILPQPGNERRKHDPHIDRRRPYYYAPRIGAHSGKNQRDESRGELRERHRCPELVVQK